MLKNSIFGKGSTFKVPLGGKGRELERFLCKFAEMVEHIYPPAKCVNWRESCVFRESRVSG